MMSCGGLTAPSRPLRQEGDVGAWSSILLGFGLQGGIVELRGVPLPPKKKG